MKRVWLMLLCCCLLLAACGGGKVNVLEPEPEPEVPEPIPQIEPTPDETDYAAVLTDIFSGIAEGSQTDFAYRADEETGTAVLTAYSGVNETLRVPERLDGFLLTGIDDGVFADRAELKILILPAAISSFGNDILKNTELTALCAPFPMEAGYLGYLWGLEAETGNRSPVLGALRYLKVIAPVAEEPFLLPENGLSDCVGLVALELPAGSELGAFALSGCENLMYLNAETLTKVGEKALDGCLSLQSLKFGAELSEIGFAVLRDCRSLMELELPFVGTSAEKQSGGDSAKTDFLGYLFGAAKPAFAKGFYPAFLKKITLSEGCTELPDFAFYECASLETLVLPDSLGRVGGRALCRCTALTELILPKACTEIGDAACAGCSALATVSLPEGATVGENAFWGCPIK